MYGEVERAISVAVDELKRCGYEVSIIKFTDKERGRMSELISEASDSKAIVLGTSTYERGIFPQIEYVANLLIRKVNVEKPILIVSSYGWGGMAGKKLHEIFSDSKFKISGMVEFRGLPSNDDEENIRENVRKLVRT
ncbi:MAG: hypothetical protein ACTSWV_03220 [Candidatus Asgardarchaeia archaeon]